MRPVIVGFARTPFHRAHRGELAEVRPEDLAAYAAKGVLESTGISQDAIEDLLLGCGYPEGEQGYNIGRIVTYLSGLPTSVPGVTINRLCGSSMQAIHTAAGAIKFGSGDCFLCGGVESMSRIQRRGFNWSQHPTLESNYPEAYISMGMTAENLAKSHSISRELQEQFALNSHQKAERAKSNGRFDDEIISVENPQATVIEDGCIRASSTLDKMATLPPAFDPDGTVTAATSSPLTDGAAFVGLCSLEFAQENGLNPLAEIISTAVAGVPPEIMGIGPVPASKKALTRAELTLDDIDVFEFNEAFSAQSLAVLSDLSIDYDDSRVNIDGGALAIGHPLGASGARITGKSAQLLSRMRGEYALSAMCIGGGMGIATILKSL